MQQAAGSEAVLPDQSELINQISSQLAAVTSKERDAACAQVRAECAQAAVSERLQLEENLKQQMAELTEQHEAKLGEMASQMARRNVDSKQFKYIVRGRQEPAMSGSVPASIFGAEPDSLLNRAYNGDWDYARDAQDRACINSDPAHWPLILNWLSFGAVPQDPSTHCRV